MINYYYNMKAWVGKCKICAGGPDLEQVAAFGRKTVIHNRRKI